VFTVPLRRLFNNPLTAPIPEYTSLLSHREAAFFDIVMGVLGAWRKQPAPAEGNSDAHISSPQTEKRAESTKKWNLGILSDPLTDEVPGKR
jgi:hypothetical protein